MDNRRNKTLLRPGLKKNKSSGSSQDNYTGYYQGYIPSAAHAKGGVTKNRHPRGGVPAQQVHDAHAATAAATPATPAPPPPPLATTTAAAQHTPFCGYCGHEWYGDNSYCVFCGKHSFMFGHGGNSVYGSHIGGSQFTGRVDVDVPFQTHMAWAVSQPAASTSLDDDEPPTGAGGGGRLVAAAI